MEKPTKSSVSARKPKVSTVDRVIKDVPAPAVEPIEHSVLWKKKGAKGEEKIDIAALQAHLFAEGKLHKDDVIQLVELATDIFASEPNVLKVEAPITVCGDVHGQFYDLIKLFEVGGAPGETTYLFLGDYVDRGSFSIEVVFLLYAYKITFPKSFFMIRGNHECRHLTQYFTFKAECLRKYDAEIYNLIMDSFDALPLAAILSNQFLCVHGGISPEIQTIDDIRNIDRFCEPPQSGPMCDLLWADPMEHFSADVDDLFEYNDVRGCSYAYSYKAVCNFLEKNRLLSIIRAHEAQDQGYRMHLKNEATGFPTVITIFSAPNYLDAYNNKGAILRYENNVMNIRQFNHSPHPYWLPNFMDVFSWSLPFVAEKIAEVLLVLLNLCDDEKIEKDDEAKRKERLRAKVKSVSKMLRMYSILVKERETLMQIKSFTPENKIPTGLLTGGVEAIKSALGDFEKARKADKVNEKRPEGSQEYPVNAKLRSRQQSLDKLKEAV